MFGADTNKFQKKENKQDEDLEAYLRQRNAALGEKTKTLAESAEEKAMHDYLKLRSKTMGTSFEEEDSAILEPTKEDIDLYLQERNKTLGEELTPEEEDDLEMQVYLRERKQVYGEE